MGGEQGGNARLSTSHAVRDDTASLEADPKQEGVRQKIFQQGTRRKEAQAWAVSKIDADR